MTDPILSSLADLARRRIASALCTVVKTEGSTPLKAGATMLVRADGTTVGTIGGGALEYSVIADATAALASGTPSLSEHRLVRDHNMCCGGTVHVFINPIPVRKQLLLFGAGHINRAVAQHAALLDFDTTVIDERAAMFESWPVTDSRILADHPRTVIDTLVFDTRTYVMIATHSHPLDREILKLCIRKPRAYLGMIGSARKAAVTRALFIDQQWATEEEFKTVDLPAGLDIAAETPQEIAVSIVANLIGSPSADVQRKPSHIEIAGLAECCK